MLQLYFIRHGQSINNVYYEDESHANYFDNRMPDPDLTPTGYKQAEMTGKFLAQPCQPSRNDPQNRYGFGLTHLYCSLMVRAVKTGTAISKATGLPLVAWQAIHETGGVFDVEMEDGEPVFIGTPGKGRSYFETNFPDLILPEDLTDIGWWNRDSEPREEYHDRAKLIIAEIFEKHGGTDDRVGLVLHGGIFTRILTAFFDIHGQSYWFLMNNCAISRVDVRADNHLRLIYMNKVDHLPDDLIT